MATRLGTTGAVVATRALLVVLVLALGACSWGEREPGLFETPLPRPTASSSTDDPTGRTDPRLPVAGEAVWTTADGTDVTVRFAVHAVRRTAEATVLDWSVTPIAGPGRRPGDPLPPGTDLGLGGELAGEQALVLLDMQTRTAYRPLADVSPEQYSRCLCTPLYAVTPGLRYGVTTLLQLVFPALAPGTFRVDVVLPDVAVVPGVAVTPVGGTPVADRPTDLTRPAVLGNPVTGAQLYAPTDRLRHLQTVVVDRVVAARGITSVVWTLYSVDDRAGSQDGPARPVSTPLPRGLRVVTTDPASGPRLRVAGRRGLVGVRWTTTTDAVPTYACLCSDLGPWSRGLRTSGGSAHLSTQVGALPARTRRVDVLFPGLPAFTDVPVSRVDDLAGPVQTVAPGTDETWSYDVANPPRGWSTAQWPTPLPAPAQVAAYAGRPERVLAGLPRS